MEISVNKKDEPSADFGMVVRVVVAACFAGEQAITNNINRIN